MLNMFDQLTALGKPLDDEMSAAMLLRSLPESYSPLISSLESRPESDLTMVSSKECSSMNINGAEVQDGHQTKVKR